MTVYNVHGSHITYCFGFSICNPSPDVRLMFNNFQRNCYSVLNSKISLHNKLLILKTIIKPVWSYGNDIWGPANPLISDQSKHSNQLHSDYCITRSEGTFYQTLRLVHKDLSTKTTTELAQIFYRRFHQVYPLVFHRQVNYNTRNPPRKLKRKRCGYLQL